MCIVQRSPLFVPRCLLSPGTKQRTAMTSVWMVIARSVHKSGSEICVQGEFIWQKFQPTNKLLALDINSCTKLVFCLLRIPKPLRLCKTICLRLERGGCVTGRFISSAVTSITLIKCVQNMKLTPWTGL